jgi:hypothetical protein
VSVWNDTCTNECFSEQNSAKWLEKENRSAEKVR